jgi:hypothetical protein
MARSEAIRQKILNGAMDPFRRDRVRGGSSANIPMILGIGSIQTTGIKKRLFSHSRCNMTCKA